MKKILMLIITSTLLFSLAGFRSSANTVNWEKRKKEKSAYYL